MQVFQASNLTDLVLIRAQLGDMCYLTSSGRMLIACPASSANKVATSTVSDIDPIGWVDASASAIEVPFFPAGNGADDSPALQALIQSLGTTSRRVINMQPGTYTWLTHVDATDAQLTNLTIRCSRNTVHNGTLPYTTPWINSNQQTVTPTTTVAVDAAEGATAVNLDDVSAFAAFDPEDPDNAQWVTLKDNRGRAMYRVMAVNSGTGDVTLDGPLEFNVTTSTQAFLRTPCKGFRFEGNGCQMNWTWTGGFQDQRILHFVESVDCYIGGIREYNVSGSPQAVFGFDQGCVNCVLEDIDITGEGTGVANVDAVAIECMRGGRVSRIMGRSINAVLWVNSCFGTVIEQINGKDVGYGIFFSTLDTNYPLPSRRLTIDGLKVDKITSGGSGFAAGQAYCLIDSNVDNLQIDGRTAGTNAGINLDGGCTDIRIGKAKVDNVAVATRGAGGAVRNSIEQLNVSGIGQLSVLSNADELTIKRLDGSMAATSSVFCTLTSGGTLRILSGKLAATITSNWMLASVPGANGTLEWSGLELVKSVGGTSYGLSNAGRSGRFTFRDCKLGAWTGAAGIHPTSVSKVCGESTLSGSFAIVGGGANVNGWNNRGSVTLNGTTVVPWVYPAAAATDTVRFRCTATGGGSHGPPKATLVANTSVAPAISAWSSAAGGTWVGGTTRFTEDTANTTHYFYSAATSYVRGPAWATGTAKPISGGHTWFVVQLGAASFVYLNASGAGAVGTAAGNAVGSISANGDGSYTWTVYTPDMTSSLVQIYTATADGTISYLGNSSVYEFSAFTLYGLNRYDFSAEATNVDVYSFEIC